MHAKLLVIAALLCVVRAHTYNCSRRSATLLLKRPAYEFSVKLLERVAQQDAGHFVYSPLSTWLQLLSVAEGARGQTLRELWNITKHHRNRCFKKQLSTILFRINRDLKHTSRRRGIIIVDKFMNVKNSYIRDVHRLYGIKTLLENFNNPEKSAAKVNKFVSYGTENQIPEVVYYDDFINTVFLMTDANYFNNTWKAPFNPEFTREEPFYSSSYGDQIGTVNMMTQTGYFLMTEFPKINARVLELPLSDRKFSFLIFLPIRGGVWIGELLYSLEMTRLTSVYNMFRHTGLQLVKVKIPRFKITTNIENLPELIHDMGVKRIFNPNLAELSRISNYKMYVSLMTQISEVEVTERGVRARSGIPDTLINDKGAVEFIANKPFAFMIVDKETEFIMYAGMYSNPSLY
ncbi:hypothetical protein O3G_MSEX010853 [Manduca sexta]|uniref:Serpin domain-containing protein n=1 Tax=Manduca sexta TaxID=7130 RepID=A0A922CU47_MANSE|nr:hypothetical protein O3G_MSEX010853 [Manduca sexta]KAG6458420.1 hypothetical protein O3G_MSEX010853 [Manduca sexta]